MRNVASASNKSSLFRFELNKRPRVHPSKPAGAATVASAPTANSTSYGGKLRAADRSHSQFGRNAVIAVLVLLALLAGAAFIQSNAWQTAQVQAQQWWASSATPPAPTVDAPAAAASSKQAEPEQRVVCEADSNSAFSAPAATLFEQVLALSGGTFGMVLASTALLIGGTLTAARGSPMPAILGIAQAAMLVFLPQVMAAMFGCTLG